MGGLEVGVGIKSAAEIPFSRLLPEAHFNWVKLKR